MNTIREALFNKTFNPFYFQYDYARVISGEEEAAYSWSGVNFLMGSLFPPDGEAGGSVSTNSTYGTVDLGGASTQIAFFLPSQDISQGLFKLQVGSQYHWNIYATSYLQFGINSARLRYQHDLIVNKIASAGKKTNTDPLVLGKKCSKDTPCNAVTDCFYSGYSELYKYKFPNGTKATYSLSGPDNVPVDQFDLCYDSVKPLLMKDMNAFCDWVYDKQCSIGGVYQPPLPDPKNHKFIGTSSYKYAMLCYAIIVVVLCYAIVVFVM
jgi:Golgi nucleoside diphosphatase